MNGEESKLVPNNELLEQVLVNQIRICTALIVHGALGIGLRKSIEETEALLERIKG